MEAGVRATDSVGELAGRSEILITSLPSGSALDAVAAELYTLLSSNARADAAESHSNRKYARPLHMSRTSP